MKIIPHSLKTLKKEPLDGRYLCATLQEAMEMAYDGFQCYVTSEKKHYKFKLIDNNLTALADEAVNTDNFATKAELSLKADKSYTDAQLATKSNVGHAHSDYALVNHTHDYIPNSELPNLATKTELSGKADVNHNHDARYSQIGHGHSNYQDAIDTINNTINNGRLSTTQLNQDYVTRGELSGGSLYTPLSNALPLAPGTPAAGSAGEASRADHVHPLPPVATTSNDGLMSATDKNKLDGITGTNTGDETLTTLGTKTAEATEKAIPVDNDSIGLADSESGNILKKLSWGNLKNALKSFFDGIYTTLTTGTPSALGDFAEVGTANTAARADHVHPLPPLAGTFNSGLMSAEDKNKLDGIASGATNTPLSNDAPAALSASASAGTATTAARADHVHPLPAVANTSTNGLMSASDKSKLDAITGTNTGDETTTTLGTKIYNAAAKTTPADADLFGISDSAAGNVLKKFSWANLKTMILGTATPAALASSGSVGTSSKLAREDHVHPLPAVATTSTNGLMSSSDKSKIDRDLKKTVQTLTDGSTITWDISNGYNASVTLGGNRTLSITNAQAGDYGCLLVCQDGTGNRTLTLPANSRKPNGTLALSTGANCKDLLMFYYDGFYFYWVVMKNFY